MGKIIGGIKRDYLIILNHIGFCANSCLNLYQATRLKPVTLQP